MKSFCTKLIAKENISHNQQNEKKPRKIALEVSKL